MKIIKIRCPYHQEKTPSCVIKGEIFHCFGCGESGSIEKINNKLKDNGREVIKNEL